jgi:bacteriocin biosynthesis cyclodehydratase domain-containing protein
MHLQLLPGLHRAWRGPQSLQLGISPRHATVLDGLTPRDAALVERLGDGVDPVELAAADDRQRQLITLLREAGALVPARAGRAVHAVLEPWHEDLEPDAEVWALVHRGCGDGWDLLAERVRHHVLVVGSGRVSVAAARALAAAGVGGVERRGRLTERGVRARSGRGRAQRPSCVVLVEGAAADSGRAEDLVRRDIPHLSVVVREGDVVVGPLVRPGDGPCLRCLDLHRAELDPMWPQVLAQLLTTGRRTPEESAVAGIAGGLAALQVLALLDGRSVPAALGATLEVELPDGLTTRRPWAVHPDCGCCWPPDGDDSGSARQDHSAPTQTPAPTMSP